MRTPIPRLIRIRFDSLVIHTLKPGGKKERKYSCEDLPPRSFCKHHYIADRPYRLIVFGIQSTYESLVLLACPITCPINEIKKTQ